MKLGKKTQHEMTGFIIIIVMVMIIGVIFLGISLRKHTLMDTKNAEISNFIVASGYITSDCAGTYSSDYKSVKELTEGCYSSLRCLDGRSYCEVLEKIYDYLLPRFKPAGTIGYYKMSFSFIQGNESSGRVFLKIEPDQNRSSCTSSLAGTEDIILGATKIRQEMEICTLA